MIEQKLKLAGLNLTNEQLAIIDNFIAELYACGLVVEGMSPEDDIVRLLTQRAADCCPRCGSNDWRDAICPDTLEICNVCGNSR